MAERKGREGGRWINERPTAEDFAAWFKDAVKVDPALNIEDYVGGVVLIPAVDSKVKVVTGFHNGSPVIEERAELSYIPYAKVETRINYFWDLIEAHSDNLIGEVEKVTPPRLPVDPQVESSERTEAGEKEIYRQPGGLAQMAHQLPEGFSIMSVPVGNGYAHFLNCTVRVAIYRKDDRAHPLRQGVGTKQVPLLIGRSSPYADPSSLMKAETGALGRALGFAGIFIIPGSGVATAEDMIEALAQGPTAAQEGEGRGPAAPEAPPARTGAEQTQDDEEQLRNHAIELFKTLKEDHPGMEPVFVEFARERKIRSLGSASGAALRGAVKKLEKLIDQAQAHEEASDGDAGEEAAAESG